VVLEVGDAMLVVGVGGGPKGYAPGTNHAIPTGRVLCTERTGTSSRFATKRSRREILAAHKMRRFASQTACTTVVVHHYFCHASASLIDSKRSHHVPFLFLFIKLYRSVRSCS